jgi:hypothetical protein
MVEEEEPGMTRLAYERRFGKSPSGCNGLSTGLSGPTWSRDISADGITVSRLVALQSFCSTADGFTAYLFTSCTKDICVFFDGSSPGRILDGLDEFGLSRLMDAGSGQAGTKVIWEKDIRTNGT